MCSIYETKNAAVFQHETRVCWTLKKQWKSLGGSYRIFRILWSQFANFWIRNKFFVKKLCN